MTSGRFMIGLMICCLALTGLAGAAPADAQELRVASSAQVYEVFKGQLLKAFSEQSGVKTDFTVSSSATAVRRLSLGTADLAATAEPLTPQDLAHGLVARPFCQDSLAVIVHPQIKASGLSQQLLMGIFTGAITNWSQVGDMDMPIRVILPSSGTAAYRSFVRLALDGREPVYDVMTFLSTGVVEAVRKYKGSIGFVNLTAAQGDPQGVRVVRVEGLEPTAASYPYREVFSLVTVGQPQGPAAKFVDYVFSPEGQKVITSRGLVSVTK